MSDLELITRLLLSICFGILIGIERQWHHKTAGLKTNSLVALGATTIAIIAQLGFANPSQVAAGVVTGIGFVGAGVIIRHGGSVQGVNSAATLWITASMGLALGVGRYKMACLVLIIVLASQFLLRRLAEWIDQRSGLVSTSITWRVIVKFNESAADKARSAWDAFAGQSGVSVIKYSEAKQESAIQLEVLCALSAKRAGEITALSQTFTALPGVTQAEWSQADSEQEE
ncbi:MAG TPA: MgtC/SapB family protein [Blastocatellia bacterium]|nr:MgtC/SapB family protein [Blastocatellia bacterium]